MVKLMQWMIALMLLCIPLGAGAAGLEPVQQEVITRGAVLEQYQVETGKGSARVYVTKMDLEDPYLKLGVLFGRNRQLGSNQTVQAMAEEAGAIAAINGGFFDMAGGTPLGPLYSDSQWITTPSSVEGLNSFGLTRRGVPEILKLSFQGSLTTEEGAFWPVYAVNKTISMVEKLNVFDSHWNLDNWPVGNLASYVAAVVEDGEVTQILLDEKPDKIPADGYVLLGHGAAANFLLGSLYPGQEVTFDYTVTPEERWDFVIGGHTPLVSNGTRSQFTKTSPGYNARTAVGYWADGETLAWVVVDYGQGSSGMTLEELADFMIALGIDQGLNLDGGGSATLISRRPGDMSISLMNEPQRGAVRKVPDGLALYSTAPQGELKELLISALPFLLVGEKTEIGLKAVDEYSNPLDVADISVRWSGGGPALAVDGSTVTAQQPGTGMVRLKAMGMEAEYPLEVAGRDSIQSLSFDQGSLVLEPGQSAALVPTLQTKSGQSRKIKSDLLTWTWLEVEGRSGKSGLTAGDKMGSGWLVGTYDRFSAMVPVQIGTVTKPLLDFEKQPALGFTGLPATISGSFQVSQASAREGSWGGKLDYDFSLTSGDTEIAYGDFLPAGIAFPGPASGITLWVNGDNSGHWLRAEVRDSTGQVQYLTLAQKVNWKGWKEVGADFSSLMTSPVLKRIYLVNQGLPGGANLKGSIQLDQIQYKTSQAAAGGQDITLKLRVNQKAMWINGQESAIDQGPLVENGRSYIPARSIVEALGGKVYWDGTDKMVRVISGGKMIDMWINDREHTIVSGVSQPQDTAPIIRSGRTLVPVRLVTEGLGYKVEWNKGEITVH